MLKLHKIIRFLIVIITINDANEIKDQFQWNYINFTWPNPVDYQYHLQMGNYIPENNTPTKIKLHNNRLYIALGRFYPGTPVTLGWVSMNAVSENPLITPYPNWYMNNLNGFDCTTLQNVNAFEIDAYNTMWILDGIRNNDITRCPAKLVLYNMTSNKIIRSYNFPQEPFSNYNLAQIVLDGNYAYISDSNNIDPGIVIYSKYKNKSWKIHDGSMFPNLNALTFVMNKTKYSYYHPIGPIAISPFSKSKKSRFIFFSPVSSYNIYKMNVNVLQNEENLSGNSWRQYVQDAGTKKDQSYDYGMKQNGDLYFCLLNRNSIAKWNIETSFRQASFVTTNDAIDWCTGFAFEGSYIYLLTGNLGRYLVAKEKPKIGKDFNFRVLRISIRKTKKGK